jgi:hypothetical protein
VSARAFCPDNELFERLVSELAVSMAPPVNHPARSIGPRGFHLGVDTTLTTLDAGESQWLRGTEGEHPDADDLINPSPSWVMIWNRVEARKGLPFGLELGSTLAQAVDTSLWSFGLQLKWALFEGFHSGVGRLPDLSIGGGFQQSLGSHQLSIQLFTLDLVASKRFVVDRTVQLSPFLGAQLLFVDAQSEVVDLTPGGEAVAPAQAAPEDAFGDCMPDPAGQPAQSATYIECADGSRGDFINQVAFNDVSQRRMRLGAGARLRYDFFTAGISVMLDLLTPAVQAPIRDQPDQPDVTRQLAFNFSLGAVL